MTLTALIRHSFHLYGPRNRTFLASLRDRIDYLNLAIGDLQDAVRKDHPPAVLGAAIARILSRIFCVAEHFWNLPANADDPVPLVAALARKYPAAHCSYCRHQPCVCTERRHAAELTIAPAEKQLAWTLAMWQAHLDTTYGARNRARGIENLLNRLFREIGELSSLHLKIAYLHASREEIEEEFALELADALAWTLAIATVLGVNGEEAFLQRYERGCRKCRQSPCRCTHFTWEQAQWGERLTSDNV